MKDMHNDDFIPTFIYTIHDPELHNRGDCYKKIGFAGIVSGFLIGLAGLVGLCVGENMQKGNYECEGD